MKSVENDDQENEAQVVTIWVDADACPRPVKDMVFRASERLKLPVKLVANSQMHVPRTGLVELVLVASGFDVADDHIAERVGRHDIVITADIPLADAVVKNGSIAISPKGELFTAESIGERLAVRNLLAEIRSSGEFVGGGRPYSDQDKKAFAAAFDRTVTKLLKNKR